MVKTEQKVMAISWRRWNAGVAAKRAYGSTTATVFVVAYAKDGGQSVWIEAYGKTPSDRKTNAIRVAMPYLEGKTPIPARNDETFTIRAYPQTGVSNFVSPE